MVTKKNSMVLRTIYLPYGMDEKLRLLAFQRRQSKGHLIREILAKALKLKERGTQ